MRITKRRLILILLTLLYGLLGWGVCFLYHVNDFVDSPALVMEITDNGCFVLDTHEGRVTSQLRDVEWNSVRQMPGLAEYLEEAVGDYVEWSNGRAGLTLWYIGKDGAPTCLNESLTRKARESGAGPTKEPQPFAGWKRESIVREEGVGGLGSESASE